MSDKKKTCFVITPIGDDNSDIRRHIDGIIDQVIEPAIGDKYTIIVSHREFEIGSINDRIIRSIYESDLVIANITNTNPNVMFELAIRYSFGKPAIVIAEKGTKLPFDVIDQNTIFYINDLVGAEDLKKEICKYEKKIDLGGMNYGPVYKVINKIPLYNEVETRGEAGEDVSKDKILDYIVDRLDTIEKNISTINKAKVYEDEDLCCDIWLRYKLNISKQFILNGIEKIVKRYEKIKTQIEIDDCSSVVVLRGSRIDVKIAATRICEWAAANGMACEYTI